MGSGSFKGHGGVQRGRQYGMMILLAFGAALLGVMALHKLREGRISNLLLRDKDREIFSLNLLLQRERDHNKEMKRKFEGMKKKMYAFRTQKMELDSVNLEMQSTVGSLKDEMRAMESALQEKDNELKMLREKIMEASRKVPEEDPLREILKLKEAEIENLKQRLEKQVNIMLESSNDPSSLPQNSSMHGGEVRKDETSNVGVEQKGELASESNRTSLIQSKNEILNGEVASNSDEGSADEMKVRETEKLQEKRDSSDEHHEQGEVSGEGNGTGDHRIDFSGERKSDSGEGTNTTPNERSTLKGADEVSRNRNENGNTETNDGNEGLEGSGVGKGGMRLETSDKFDRYEADYGVMGKQGNLHVNRRRGKKWRILARNRRLGNKRSKKIRHIGDAKEIEQYGSEKGNQVESTGRSQQNGTHSRRDESENKEEQERKEGREEVKNKSLAADSNEDRANGGAESEESQGNIDKDLNFSVAKSIEFENSEDKGDVEGSAMNGGEKGPLENEQEEMNSGTSSMKGEVFTNSASQGKDNRITNENREHEANVDIQRQEDQGANAVQEITEVGTGGAGLAADKERVPERNEEPRHSEDEDSKEFKADGIGQDFSQGTDDSTSQNNENKDEYQAETNDHGF